MRPDDPRLLAADAQAEAARSNLMNALQIARERLAPGALRKEAGDRIMDAALDGVSRARQHAKNYPVQIVAAAAILGGFLARAPLSALFRRLYVMVTQQMSNTARDENGQHESNN